jgi:hypothetical protein
MFNLVGRLHVCLLLSWALKRLLQTWAFTCLTWLGAYTFVYLLLSWALKRLLQTWAFTRIDLGAKAPTTNLGRHVLTWALTRLLLTWALKRLLQTIFVEVVEYTVV